MRDDGGSNSTAKLIEMLNKLKQHSMNEKEGSSEASTQNQLIRDKVLPCVYHSGLSVAADGVTVSLWCR